VWKSLWIICLFLLIAVGFAKASRLKSDLNGDGRVDMEDLAILTEEWMMEDCMANNYLSFNGTAGYVTVPSNAALNLGSGDFTICGWANVSGIGFQRILCKGSGISGQYDLYLNALNKLVIDVSQNGNGYVDFKTVADVPMGWFYFAVVKTGTSFTMTINNDICSVVEDSYYSSWPNCDSNEVLSIGATAFPVDFFSGSLDDLRIYKSALTLEQIQAIYNGGIGTKYTQDESPTASAAWNMDEGTGTKITDAQAGLEGTFSATGVTWQSGGTPLPLSDSGNIAVTEDNEGF
jgi:hypothetical protein